MRKENSLAFTLNPLKQALRAFSNTKKCAVRLWIRIGGGGIESQWVLRVVSATKKLLYHTHINLELALEETNN